MSIFIHEETKTFHLSGAGFSYVMQVLPDGTLSQVYTGAAVHDREDFSYLVEGAHRSHTSYPQGDIYGHSLELLRQEYPSFGTGDLRQGAVSALQPNGSRALSLKYESYEVQKGKPSLPGLPATYVEEETEADTLVIKLRDAVSGLAVYLSYSIFSSYPALARSVRLVNEGEDTLYLDKALSFCLDLPDADYDMMQLSGTWARERHPVMRRLVPGIQSIESMRGYSSHQQNPFLLLKRPDTNEFSGEAMAVSFIYSGNFYAGVYVDTYGSARVLMGLHPDTFRWKLSAGAEFVTPEAVLAYSGEGLNGLSQVFHKLYGRRLARGEWRDKPRPILINNWEATYFNFNEEKLLAIAEKAKDCGVELFVLDDGWFGARRLDNAGLGDWTPALELLPNGIKGLSEKVEALGLRFGLWFEPEMVNPDSDLYRAHPDWALAIPGREPALGRKQLVLDFSRKEVVDCIHEQMAKLLSESKISYVKWDMNRSIADCYSATLPADQQGEVYHRYILGVYDLYERLTKEFPHVLFESCAGGGGRFDAGLLAYAPQCWTSDDTDAAERLKIQYGTSYAYPISSMGSHVSAVPNHQVNRITSLKTRADVAYFGTYGYELDLNLLSEEEQQEVREYTQFMKEHRELLQFGTFYRLKSPFEGQETAWMVVSEDQREAIVGDYRILAVPNAGLSRLRFAGLLADTLYEVTELAPVEPLPPHAALYAGGRTATKTGGKHVWGRFYGDQLMHAGLPTTDSSAGLVKDFVRTHKDFSSTLFLLTAVDE